jgi:uncharacterized protein
MRLDDFDPNSIKVEDQRGGGFSVGGAGGKVGCGTLVIALIAALVFGVDPTSMLGSVQEPQQQGPVQTQGGTDATSSCTLDPISRETCAALSSLNKTWGPEFAKQGYPFEPPKLVFYSQMGRSGCGAAQSAMGPFYCPSDQGIYIDTDFYKEMERRMGASGDFARAYVIAHEYGHHIQKLTGVADQIRSLQSQNPRQSNQLQVRMELQADCYAGVWVAKNKDRIEAGDMEEGLNAAHQIGDDTLTGGRAPESAFTHGSSAQRVAALRRGMSSGDDNVCNAFVEMR